MTVAKDTQRKIRSWYDAGHSQAECSALIDTLNLDGEALEAFDFMETLFKAPRREHSQRQINHQLSRVAVIFEIRLMMHSGHSSRPTIHRGSSVMLAGLPGLR